MILLKMFAGSVKEIVVPANYNSPGQIVISGSNEGIDEAIEILKGRGAKMAVKLAVGWCFPFSSYGTGKS